METTGTTIVLQLDAWPLPEYEPSVGTVAKALQVAGEAEAVRAAEAERWRDISVSTDVNAPGALPALRF